jgi:signal peptidase I
VPLQPQKLIAKHFMAATPEPMDDLRQNMAAELLRSHGFLRLRVLGQSMLPTIWPGDVVTIRSQIAGAIKIADIGVFQRDHRFFVHRVKNILVIAGATRFVTRGDSAADDDPLFPADTLLGKVALIQHKNRSPVPSGNLSLCARAAGWVFARSSSLRNLALRIDAMRGDGARGIKASAGHDTRCRNRELLSENLDD